MLEETLGDIFDVSGQPVLIFKFEVIDVVCHLTRRMLNNEQILIELVISDRSYVLTIDFVSLELPDDVLVF